MSTFTNTAREVEMPNGDVVVIHNAPTGGENTTSNIKKFKYDDNGHVTESTAADAEDLNLSGYSTPTTGTTTIGASDDVQTAIGKLDHQSQIDQTNILLVQDATKELVDKGAKNIFDITTPDLLRDTVVTPLSNGGATLSCNNAAWTQYGKNTDVEVGKKYKVIVYIDSITGSVGTDFNVNLSQDSTFLPITPTNTGEYSVEVESTATTLGVAIFINNSGTPKSLSINMRMMICTLDEWKVSQQYIPFALPNYDLTVRESEDRAALAEQVDEGAKNLIPTPTPRTETSNTATVTFNADGSITAARTTATTSGSAHDIAPFGITLPIGKYVWSSGVNVPTTCTLTIDFSDGSHAYVNHGDAPYNYEEFEITATKNITHIYLWLGTETSSATYYPMICTEADWKVSQNYAPFALPNTDLTQREAVDRAALVEVVDSGAKNRLDDIGWMNDIAVTNGTKSVSNGAITLTATGADCYTEFITTTYPENYNIYVTAGEQIVLTWKYTAGDSQTNDRVYIFKNGQTTDFVYANAADEKLIFTVPSGCTFITFRIGVATSGKSATYSNIMICSLSDWGVSKKYVSFEYPDTLSTVYRSKSSVSRTISYKIKTSDFMNKFPTPDNSCGTYLISVVSWSTTPTFSLYAVSYSGGVTTYTNVTKIAGSDLTITITGDTMSFDTSGKVVIYALK